MTDSKAKMLMFAGIGAMVVGVLLPFMIVIKLLPSTLFLNFFSYILQIVGMVLGMIGLVNQAVQRKKK